MKCDTYNTGKSGVALILVIGLLALMMVLAVAFSIYMRTERVAAGNFKNDVKTRQLLYVALNQALRDIDASVGTSNYPPWDVLGSSGYGSALNITNGGALSYIPSAPFKDGAPMRAQWIDVAQGGVDARIAYLVVNCSGLLDVNQAGGSLRLYGTNASEMQIAAYEVVDTNKLFKSRPFFTVQELNSYGSSNDIIDPGVFVLSDFSMCSVDHDPVYVGGASNWSSASDIVKAFIDSGLDAPSAGLAYTNLLDYVDSDSVPKALDVGTVESVPMISEVVLTYELTLSTSNTWESAFQCQVEWAYPFLTAVTNSFDVKATLSFLPQTGDNVNLGFTTNVVRNIGVIPAGVPFDVISVLDDALIRSGGPTVGAQVEFECTLSLEVRLADGTVCDKVPAGAAQPMKFTVKFTPVNDGVMKTVTKWKECSDPRFNWNPGDEPWYDEASVRDLIPAAEHTLGAENNITKYHFGLTSEDYDRDTHWYVANRPLKSVGELGMLAYMPLKTIRLYEHSWATESTEIAYHSVLDHFRITTNLFDVGKVHLNSKYHDVLASAFLGMPRNELGATLPERLCLNEDEADNVASNIIRGRMYGGVSELGTIDWNGMTGGGYNEFQAEAFLRNTVGLLSLRQNYFIILLYAQSAKVVVGLPDRSVVAGVRAVAAVWRDPVKTQGRNPIVVRSFKILGE